ncbi:hypothetical protein LG200_05060 [Methylobacillus caricis]|uniref:hypothetical protein n=1 Tax=Methylobacillus caricis TaxID=1971611 RepID=UPI001CFF5C96|nr:hypothetical protein [Methylobacillus caricis]MCB5187373.1 hypothetical protein [Methylobacillus caricis]
MSRKLILPGISATIPPLNVVWDIETGELSGPDAGLLHAHIKAQVEQGYVIGNPYPSTYEINDPLHSMADMALVLSLKWVVPEDLSKHLPQVQEDDLNTIAGSDGFEAPIEIIH